MMENVSGGTHVDLSGVPETMLWPLWNRAAEQARPDRLIDDPLAADLVDRIDYDFAGSFGKPSVFHAIRSRLCDDLIGEYAANCTGHPVVVSLGDGLETQAWRLGDGAGIRWYSVDVPEAIAVRKRLLPRNESVQHIACSALDPRWINAVPRDAAPFVSAAGLLMYFKEAEVDHLLSMIAERLPGARIFFDTIPPFFSAKTMEGFRVTKKYTAPKMPWGISVDDIVYFLRSIPGLRAGQVWTYADPYPARTKLYHLLSKIGPLRRSLAGGLALAVPDPCRAGKLPRAC